MVNGYAQTSRELNTKRATNNCYKSINALALI